MPTVGAAPSGSRSRTTAAADSSSSLSFMVAPRSRCGAARQVGSLHSPPGRENPAPSFARSWLHRALTPARRDKSARCTRLRVAKTPRLRSLAHGCTALSLRRGATSRLAALASGSRKPRAFVRSLMVAPRSHSGAAPQVGSLHSPPGRENPAPSFARSWLHRALTPARRDKSARCTRLRVAKTPRLRSLAHGCTALSLRRGATSRLAALASGSRKPRAFVRSLMVAPRSHSGAARQVGSLHSPPGRENPAPSFARSWLHRALTPARRHKSARCTRLRVAKTPRLRSLAHGCTALSLRRGATSRLAALASGSRKPRAFVRSLMVAPRSHAGAARQVGSLHSPPGRENPAPSFGRSWLHRALTPARRDKSARCTRLRVAKTPRLRSLAHGCTALSLRRGATSRLAALASGSRKPRAFVRSLMVAPRSHSGAARQVGSLHSPPGRENPAPSFGRSWLHRALTPARRDKSARCTRLRVA